MKKIYVKDEDTIENNAIVRFYVDCGIGDCVTAPEKVKVISLSAHDKKVRAEVAREILEKVQETMIKLCIYCHNEGYKAGKDNAELFEDGLEGDISNLITSEFDELSEQYKES